MEINSEQAKFEGWAIVDALGHQRHAGYVTTEHFGQTVLFKVATPAREARTRNLESGGEHVQGYGYLYDEALQVNEAAMPATERYIGAGSIYMLTPTPQSEVLQTIEAVYARKVVGVQHADGTPYEKPKQDGDNFPF